MTQEELKEICHKCIESLSTSLATTIGKAIAEGYEKGFMDGLKKSFRQKNTKL